MRAGATVAADAPLGSKLDGLSAERREGAAARLRIIEAELIEALREESSHAARKSRIVDALRQKPEAE